MANLSKMMQKLIRVTNRIDRILTRLGKQLGSGKQMHHKMHRHKMMHGMRHKMMHGMRHKMMRHKMMRHHKMMHKMHPSMY